MALGFFRAKYLGMTYLFHGLEDGFKSGSGIDPYYTLLELKKAHEDFEITDRLMLIPEQLLTFNNETEN